MSATPWRPSYLPSARCHGWQSRLRTHDAGQIFASSFRLKIPSMSSYSSTRRARQLPEKVLFCSRSLIAARRCSRRRLKQSRALGLIRRWVSKRAAGSRSSAMGSSLCCRRWPVRARSSAPFVPPTSEKLASFSPSPPSTRRCRGRWMTLSARSPMHGVSCKPFPQRSSSTCVRPTSRLQPLRKLLKQSAWCSSQNPTLSSHSRV
mmetsp:Transcript_85200/g.170222  ORF Transcript_85200/g.170222 Transcript_85200/m.170222 type:complete len:205 (-) Transcript_85200:3437-4051(-)